MEVFVVIQGDHGGTNNLGVFSSYEKAQSFVENYIENTIVDVYWPGEEIGRWDSWYGEYIDIQVLKLDNLIEELL